MHWPTRKSVQHLCSLHMSLSQPLLEAAADEARKVVAKQKETQRETERTLQRLINLVEVAKLSVDNGADFDQGRLNVFNEQIAHELKNAVGQTKELHSSVGKLGKALDKTMDVQLDICKALRDVPMPDAPLNQVIAEHFFREGRFEVGEIFAVEAGLDAVAALKEPYVSMHSILQQIKIKNLQPALAWVSEHKEQLAPDGRPSAFEFKLHSLNFLCILKEQGQQAALRYAKQNFLRFQHRFMHKIQKLMGCMLYHDKPFGGTKYRDLLSPTVWDEVAMEFTRQACSLMGQACESPLAVAVAAGTAALPLLFKLVAVMERNSQDLSACEQLPVELDLGDEFVFHSIFACPVSRDQSTPENPPMLLPCNHVLCEQSVLKIAKSRNRVFKCPYCPVEARADNLRPLVFPDVE